MAGTDRRDAIAEAVLELVSHGGARALSHGAIDTHLGLPRGSSSYYFRTRTHLISAAADRLIERSRAQFSALATTLPRAPTARQAAEAIAGYADHLATRRVDEVRARFALAPEVDDPSVHQRLTRTFFSPGAAAALCEALGHPDPAASARGLLAYLEGVTAQAALGVPDARADVVLLERLLTPPDPH
ncbi:TetR/AcrR family transcriptional regulator [Zhihengliuella salsuginis]|uniref:HTH tetR-type domain-containing protein n=1 Tax=Zhihengliuella salsuginis TaxID=578222 RepID=A0ABQ3GGR5_9MICC|nr:transcriptional regulator [Zhihengliuella salsuginis]GHD05062.1 hypothetical protein GCM10008096_13450 [Zhihengliuella salsuginis]